MAGEAYTLEQAEEEIAQLRGQLDQVTEILNLQQTDVVPNAVAGEVKLYAAAGVNLLTYMPPSGTAFNIPGTSLATFPITTVTAASLTDISIATIPANDAVVGAVYELDVWGNGVQGSTLQTLQMRVNLGGTGMDADLTMGTTAFTVVSTGFRWRACCRVVCLTTGAGGTWQSYLHAVVNDVRSTGGNVAPGNANFAVGFQCEGSNTTTKDTTASQTLSLRVAWGATTGAPTITSRVQTFRRIA